MRIISQLKYIQAYLLTLVTKCEYFILWCVTLYSLPRVLAWCRHSRISGSHIKSKAYNFSIDSNGFFLAFHFYFFFSYIFFLNDENLNDQVNNEKSPFFSFFLLQNKKKRESVRYFFGFTLLYPQQTKYLLCYRLWPRYLSYTHFCLLAKLCNPCSLSFSLLFFHKYKT